MLHTRAMRMTGLLCCLCVAAVSWGGETAYSSRLIEPDALRVKEEINVMAISPDGKIVATGCPSGEPNITLWELETGRKKHRLRASHHVNGIGFSPDGKLIYAMAMGGMEHLEIWEVASGKKTHHLRLFGRGAYVDTFRHDFSPCGKYFLTLEKDSEVTMFQFGKGAKEGPANEPVLGIWDLAASKPLHKFNGFPGQVGRFLPDGKKFIVGMPDGKLQIAAVDSGEIAQTLTNGDTAICDIRFSPAGDVFVVADEKGGVNVWRLGDKIEKTNSFLIPGVTSELKAGFPIEISADCTRVAAHTGNAYSCFGIKSGKKIAEFGKDTHTPMALSANGKMLAHMMPEGVAVWNVDSKTIMIQFVPSEESKLPENSKFQGIMNKMNGAVAQTPAPAVHAILPCLDDQSFIMTREDGKTLLFSPKP